MIELTEEQIIAKSLQEIQDTLNGGITHRNMKSIRSFFVISGQDSLDTNYPMYLPFNIPLSTQTVVSVCVSFWLLPFRAYSKATQSNTQQTSSSGGGTTTSSGGGTSITTPSGGGTTSGSGGSIYTTSSTSDNGDMAPTSFYSSGGYLTGVSGWGYFALNNHKHTVSVSAHYHSCPNHQHSFSISDHTHTVGNHTHTIDGHSHNITFGIYEENHSPSVTLLVSRDGGYTYPYTIGTYSVNQYSLDITSCVDTPGSKMLKFESSALGRLSAQIEITLDMSR